jgi:hypothetical protein
MLYNLFLIVLQKLFCIYPCGLDLRVQGVIRRNRYLSRNL